MPATGMVQQSGPDRPYLGVSLSLDPAKFASLLLDLPPQSYQEGQSGGYSVCRMTPELLGALLRMLQLMERPQDIPALAPAYERDRGFRVRR
ncbi:AraC family transcriptional regulator, partial [Rhizobium johnstonii]|uniref:AraC family transcriptional regulator n=1 Tax=Rhizobium johnstonii TaxID=3019933 RepID=UPI003F97B37B